jgi:hypothetical protein
MGSKKGAAIDLKPAASLSFRAKGCGSQTGSLSGLAVVGRNRSLGVWRLDVTDSLLDERIGLPPIEPIKH